MKRIVPLMVLASLLNGCATVAANQPEADSTIETDIETARRDMTAGSHRAAKPFESVDEVWLGAVAVERKQEASYPATFLAPVTFNRDYDVTIQQLAEYIAVNHGIQVELSTDAVDASAVPRNQVTGSLDPASVGAPSLPQLPTSIQSGDAGAGRPMRQNNTTTSTGLRVAFTGTLKGFLDHLAARTNNSWRYRDGRVQFFHVDTRVFPLDVLPGKIAMQGSITNMAMGGGSGGGGGGGGGSANSATTQMQAGTRSDMSVELDQFESIVKTVEGMVSTKGKVTASPAMGHIVVTDTPSVLSRVDDYLKQANALASRQVVLDVKVFSVEGNASNGYSIEWDAVWQTLSSRFGVNLVGSGNGTGEGNSIGVSILEGPFKGSSMIVDALAKQGRTRQLTSASMVTLSGRPVPLQVGEEVAYVDSSQISLVPNVGQSQSVTTSKITAGFSMSLLPMVTSKESVMIQAHINLSSLRELRRMGTDNMGSVIEMPLIDSRHLAQNVRLNFNQTLVLTGFEQDLLRSDARGTGSANFTLLGGGKSREKRNNSLVIPITPRQSS